jgi:ubiquinone biosynthesis protein Coq4
MKSWFRLIVVWKSIRLAMNPERTKLLFDIADALYRLDAFDDGFKLITAEPSARRIIDERRLLERFDLDAFMELPTGSLGRAFAEHMKTNNLDPYFYRDSAIIDDFSFVIMRMRQTHDLWHVVTGFKTDVPGELAAQAFQMTYVNLPGSIVVVGGALLRAVLTRPQEVGEVVDSIAKGVLKGKQVRDLFGYDWEANWSRPLSEVRAELGL